MVTCRRMYAIISDMYTYLKVKSLNFILARNCWLWYETLFTLIKKKKRLYL